MTSPSVTRGVDKYNTYLNFLTSGETSSIGHERNMILKNGVPNFKGPFALEQHLPAILLFAWPATTEKKKKNNQTFFKLYWNRLRNRPTEDTTLKQRDLIRQNKEESQYSTRSMVLIKIATVTDRIRTCAISNSDSKSNDLNRSAHSQKAILQNISN
ncbi:hypothetical protein J6590_101694 [Homalodisca vitripennis]|nr:hypothetical protein J6590_101694 [Homalodisca vitripennis]